MSHPLRAALLLPVLLGGSGCAAAGLAGAPILSAVQAVTDRSVERTLPVDRSLAWAATLDALSRMGISVHDADKSGETWALKGTGEKITVSAELSRVTPTMTRLSLRVEAGRLTADKKTAEEVLNQVAAGVTTATAARPPGPSGEANASREALTALKHEIERLGTKLEEAGPGRQRLPVDAPATSGSVKPDASRVIVVPGSAGVPAVAVERDGVSSRPTPAVSAGAAASQPTVADPPGSDTHSDAATVDTVLAAPMNPIGSLKPVEALRVRQAEQ